MIRISRIILIAALIFAPIPASAQDSTTVCGSFGQAGLQTIGDQVLTVSTTVVRLTIPANTVCALVTVSTESITTRVGTAPTATDGVILTAQMWQMVGPNDIRRYGMIRAGASDSTVYVAYFGGPQ
jgi:hypothetical protein